MFNFLLTILSTGFLTIQTSANAVLANNATNASQKYNKVRNKYNYINKENQLKKLSNIQNLEIFRLILKHSSINNKKVLTNFNNLKKDLIYLGYLSNETIKLICSNQIDIQTINNVLGHNVTGFNFKDEVINLKLNKLTWTYSKNFVFNSGADKANLHWSWWTFVTLNWGLAINYDLCEIFKEGSIEALSILTDIFEYLPELLVLPVAIVAADILANVVLTNHDNGMYMDLEVTLVVYSRESEEDWNIITL